MTKIKNPGYNRNSGQFQYVLTADIFNKGKNKLQKVKKILEICDRFRDVFTTNRSKTPIYIETLETAVKTKRRVNVIYFNNGHPLAGMCIESISLDL